MSVRRLAVNCTRCLNLINTTSIEKIDSKWRCIDRLSWHEFSELG